MKVLACFVIMQCNIYYEFIPYYLSLTLAKFYLGTCCRLLPCEQVFAWPSIFDCHMSNQSAIAFSWSGIEQNMKQSTVWVRRNDSSNQSKHEIRALLVLTNKPIGGQRQSNIQQYPWPLPDTTYSHWRGFQPRFGTLCGYHQSYPSQWIRLGYAVPWHVIQTTHHRDDSFQDPRVEKWDIVSMRVLDERVLWCLSLTSFVPVAPWTLFHSLKQLSLQQSQRQPPVPPKSALEKLEECPPRWKQVVS